MSFRLVPKSVTLNDLERRNGHIVGVISQNSVAFCAYYVTVVEDTPIQSASEMYPEEFSCQRYITYGDIRRKSPPARALKCSALLSLAKI